jgi:hypothetical protein
MRCASSRLEVSDEIAEVGRPFEISWEFEMLEEYLVAADVAEIRNFAICLCDSALYDCIFFIFSRQGLPPSIDGK